LVLNQKCLLACVRQSSKKLFLTTLVTAVQCIARCWMPLKHLIELIIVNCLNYSLIAKSPYNIKISVTNVYCFKACIFWNGFFSNMFAVKNGVKQGGILSPLLFCVYFDVLINRLTQSGYGCYIGLVFLAVCVYADDIVLLLQQL